MGAASSPAAGSSTTFSDLFTAAPRSNSGVCHLYKEADVSSQVRTLRNAER